MHGNVYEWVEDDYHVSYEGAPDDGSAWVGKPRGSGRLMRGGAWNYVARGCRSATRRYTAPDFSFSNVGFRLAKSVALVP